MPSEETPSKTYALRKQVVHKTLCAEKNVHTAQTKRQLFDKCPVRHRVAVLRMTPYTKFLSIKVIFLQTNAAAAGNFFAIKKARQ